MRGPHPEAAAHTLAPTLTDPHPDVRKAAVLTLSTWPTHPAIRETLTPALSDTDADVRAYARRTLDLPPASVAT